MRGNERVLAGFGSLLLYGPALGLTDLGIPFKLGQNKIKEKNSGPYILPNEKNFQPKKLKTH